MQPFAWELTKSDDSFCIDWGDELREGKPANGGDGRGADEACLVVSGVFCDKGIEPKDISVCSKTDDDIEPRIGGSESIDVDTARRIDESDATECVFWPIWSQFHPDDALIRCVDGEDGLFVRAGLLGLVECLELRLREWKTIECFDKAR